MLLVFGKSWKYLPHYRLLFCCFSTSPFKFQRDYYKVLGVDSSASDSEIKKAYLKKCKQFHPDKHDGNKQMQEKFVEANEAYNVLSNAAMRREYDVRTNSHQQTRYSHQSPYSWGKGSQARPEDVYKEYQRYSQAASRYSNRQSFRQRDPFYEHWKRVYESKDSYKDHSPFYRGGFRESPDFKSPKPSNMSYDEKRLVLLFLGALCLVIYIRMLLATKAMRSNQSELDPYHHRPSAPNPSLQNKTNENYPRSQPISPDLNAITEDA